MRSALADLRAQPLFLRTELGRELLAEVLGLEDRPDFDFRPAAERCALQPLDRFVHRLDVPQPEAGDQLLRFSERSVDHRAFGTGEPDALAPRTWMQPFARLHHAGIHELLVVLAHRRQDFLVRHLAGLGLLARLHDHHHSHHVTPYICARSAGWSIERRANRHGALSGIICTHCDEAFTHRGASAAGSSAFAAADGGAAEARSSAAAGAGGLWGGDGGRGSAPAASPPPPGAPPRAGPRATKGTPPS